MSDKSMTDITVNLGITRNKDNLYREYDRLTDKELRESEAYLKGVIFNNLSEKYKEDNGIVKFLCSVSYIDLCNTYVRLSRVSFDNLSDRVIEELGYVIQSLDKKELSNVF